MWSIFQHMMYIDKKKRTQFVMKELEKIQCDLYQLSDQEEDHEMINHHMKRIKELFYNYI